MEVLNLNGIRYVRARVLAEEFGYTSDYVGQLCRSGKVAAHLVGRTWYVDENSIRRHKKGKQRSSKAKTVAALRKSISPEISKQEARGYVVPITKHAEETRTSEKDKKIRKHFYNKVPEISRGVYAEDTADLLPVLKEKEKKDEISVDLDVVNPDLKKVSITETSKPFVIETPKREQVRFSGKVEVVAVPEEEAVEDQSDETKDRNEISDTKPKSKVKKIKLHHPGVVSMQRKRPSAAKLAQEKNVVVTQPASTVSLVSVRRTIALSIVLAMVLGASVSLISIFLQETIFFSSEQDMQHKRVFEVDLSAAASRFLSN